MNNKEFQYYHCRDEFVLGQKEEFTAVCKVPSNEDLLKILKLRTEFFVNSSMELLFGMTKVHPDEMYCKAIGRAEAKKNVKVVWFDLININITKDIIDFTFRHKGVTIKLQTKEGRNVPYLTMVYTNAN
jgi:hypothetical protein